MKCFLIIFTLIPLVVPLFYLLFTIFTQQDQVIKLFLGIKQENLIRAVSSAIKNVEKSIKKNKIILIQHNSQQSHDLELKNQILIDKPQQSLQNNLNYLSNVQMRYFQLLIINQTHEDVRHNYFQEGFPTISPEYVQLWNDYQLNWIKQIQNSAHRIEIETLDKIKFSIIMTGVEESTSPLKPKQINTLKTNLMEIISANNIIKSIQNQAIKESKAFRLNKEISYNRLSANKKINARSLQINLVSCHLSEVDENYRNRFKSVYKYYQQGILLQKKNNDQIEIYIKEIIRQLQQTNKGRQCDFVAGNIFCKQIRIFVLYQQNYLIKEIQQINIIQTKQSSSNKSAQILQTLNYLDNLEYWTKEDGSIILLPLAIEGNQIKLIQKLSQAVVEIICQSLGLSPLLLVLNENSKKNMQKNQQQISNQKQQKLISHTIDKFLRLNTLYKYKQKLQHIQRILIDNQIPYETLPDNVESNFISVLNRLSTHDPELFESSQDASQEPILSQIVNSINLIDPFATDYKLGALLPIAIILIFPFFGFISLIFG